MYCRTSSYFFHVKFNWSTSIRQKPPFRGHSQDKEKCPLNGGVPSIVVSQRRGYTVRLNLDLIEILTVIGIGKGTFGLMDCVRYNKD